MNRPKFRISKIINKKRLIEAGKSLLIAALVISALILSVNIGLFSGLTNSDVIDGVLSLRSDTENPESGGTYTAAASPFCIVITPAAGAHYSAMYEEEAVTAAYERFSDSLGEALGSAGEPEEITDDEWEAALSDCSVYFDFFKDQRLDVLAGWLGTAMSGSSATQTARRICLAANDSGVSLYYIRAIEGVAYRCDTALSHSSLCGKIEEYLPDGSVFNFELETPFDLVDSFTVIRPGQPAVDSVTAGNPLESGGEGEAMLSVFRMNSLLAYPYTDPDGAQIFVEGDATLRIEADGILTYGWTNPDREQAAISPAQAIEIARAACEATLGARCGEASLYLSYIGSDSEMIEYSIKFDYVLNGVPVSFSDGSSAAEITITGSEITSAKMTFREYAYSDIAERPLPALYAAAVVQASGGGEPRLTYIDNMDSVAADWIIE
ncbi:MAG: hypothetical protein EOM54_06785 [Clostridia bacterium]|nr:hypothetical protein [Clostridia bacterium]